MSIRDVYMNIDEIVEGTNLLPENNLYWKEEDVPLCERGVSLSWLEEFMYQVCRNLVGISKLYQSYVYASDYWDKPAPSPSIIQNFTMTSGFIVPNVIVPLTKNIKAPLYARVPNEFRGKPTMFLSYSWDEDLVHNGFGVIDMAKMPMDMHSMKRKGKVWDFIWIDCICYNQHLFAEVALDMKNVISSIGYLGFPIFSAKPFSRLWCLWELLAAYVTKTEIQFLESSRDLTCYCAAFRIFKENFHSIYNAETTYEKDKKEILEAMVSTFGSLEAADTYFRELIEANLTTPNDLKRIKEERYKAAEAARFFLKSSSDQQVE